MLFICFFRVHRDKARFAWYICTPLKIPVDSQEVVEEAIDLTKPHLSSDLISAVAEEFKPSFGTQNLSLATAFRRKKQKFYSRRIV